MLYILLYVLKPLLLLVFRPKIYGSKAALRQKGKVIYISNHIALADPLLLAVICPRIIHFMAKKELFSLCVHFCIPPLVAGMGYAFVNVPWLDFQTLYMILFLIYLYFVYINLKRFITDSFGQNMP